MIVMARCPVAKAVSPESRPMNDLPLAHPAVLRAALLAAMLFAAGCASPPQRPPAGPDATAARGEVAVRTPLIDFELSGVVGHLQKGDRPDQRRFSYLDQPGGYQYGKPLQVKRNETEEARYQRLLGALSTAFRKAGCSTPVSSIKDAAFDSRPPEFRDPSLEAEPRIDDLALLRASIQALVAADRAWAEQLRQQAQHRAQQADFHLQQTKVPLMSANVADMGKSFEMARQEREWSKRLLQAAAQIDRNVSILQTRIASVDVMLEPSRQRLRAQLDAEISALATTPRALQRAAEYIEPFTYISHLSEELPLCGAGGLQALRTHVFDRVVGELLAPLRELFLKSTTSERSVFTGNSELDAAFFGAPVIAAEMQRRVSVIEDQRQAEIRKAAELRAAEQRRIAEARAALRAKRVRENLSPDPESVAIAWAREVAASAAADPLGTATIFLGLFGTVTYEASGEGYCRVSVSARDERDRRCTHRWSVSASELRCARSGGGHQCSFVSTVTPSGEGRTSYNASSGHFTWRPDGELDVKVTSDVGYHIWGPRGSSGSRPGPSAQRSAGEIVKEIQDLRCETGVDSKQVCRNR
jgi:hypothetical protein